MMGGRGMEADGKRRASESAAASSTVRGSLLRPTWHRENGAGCHHCGGGGAGLPVAGSTANCAANSLLERSAVADGEPKGSREGVERRKIDKAIRWPSWPIISSPFNVFCAGLLRCRLLIIPPFFAFMGLDY